MDARSRLIITGVIWFLGMVTLFVTILTTAFYGTTVPVLIGVLTALIIATGYFWNWGGLPLTTASSEQAEAEKQKRVSRADALLNTLDDETLEALRQRLADRPNTSRATSHAADRVSLDTLVDDDGELRQR